MSVVAEKIDLSLKYTAMYNEAKEKLIAASPEVMNTARSKAFQDFVAQGIPTRKNENYKYTNLQSRFLPEYKLALKKEQKHVNINDIYRCNVPQLDTIVGMTYNGWFVDTIDKKLLPQGVIFDSLSTIAKQNPNLVKNYYATLADTESDPLIALNTAMAEDGILLYIPKNTRIEQPIQIINLLESESNTFSTQRNLIIIEEGASVQLILCNHTGNANQYLNNIVSEIFVGENASLEYYLLQNQHNNSTSINSVVINQNRDSNVTTHTTTLHGGLIRNNLKFVLNGENAQANMFGMAFIDRKQHIDNFTQIIHAKPHCESNQVYKNVLDDEASGAFSGQIHVVRDAQKTNAFQRNNNLLLTDQANMQTKPQLIIDADDVKCSHGATVGQIDKEALFYLRARGIDENKARLMMMNAFTHEVVEEIKIESLRNKIDDLIEKRLRGEIARCHDCAYNC